MANLTDRLPRISAVQFATMVTAGYVALGVFYFPREAVTAAGREGLWCILLDGVVSFGLMHLMFRVNRIVPNETLGSFGPKLFGKPLGYLIAVFTIAYHMMLAVSAAVLFSFVLGNIFLPNTPIWAIDGALTVVSLYMAWGGTAALARTLEASYTPVAFLTLLTGFLTVTLIRHPLLLLPPDHFTVLPILKGAFREYIMFIGFQLTVTLYPFVRNEQRRQAEHYTYIGLAVIVGIMLICYEVTMSTFGPDFLPSLRWPIVSLLRILALKGFFIDKFGMLVVALWTIVVAAFVSVRLWGLAHDIAAVLHLDGTKSYQGSLLASATIVVTGAILIPNAKITDLINENYLVGLGLGYLTVIPFLTITVATFRKQRVQELRTKEEPPG